MPPASNRKTRARRLPDTTDRSDADDPVTANATPSRKRRRVNAADAAASPNGTDPIVAPSSRTGRKSRQNDIQVYEDGNNGADEPIEEVVNTVIRGLRLPAHEIQARVDYDNERQQAEHPEGKQAYAKIAGNGWTYYVEELSVRIGRPPDERPSSAATNGAEGHTPSNTDKSLVHIDLGPSKLVSRQHAEIVYDEKTGKWQFDVIGRNGAKLDDRPLKRGDYTHLHSGSVVEIADTQMMFITPNVEPEIHPSIRDAAKARYYEDEEDEDDVDLMPPPPGSRTPQRSNGATSRGNGADSTRPVPSSQQPNHKQTRGSAHSTYNESSGDNRFPSSAAKVKSTPAYTRTMLLDTNDDIDYAQDSAKDLKPPHSYAQLIGMAILSTPEEKMTLSKIYDWIKERYAFYRLNGGGWQNSIRHNLSLNKSFEKVARRTDEPGKGMKWQIVPDQREEFMKKSFSSARKGTGRSSIPGSPMKDIPSSALGDDPFVVKPKYQHSQDSKAINPFNVKNSPGSTPPMANYPSIKSQTYTPDRPGHYNFMPGAVDSSPRNGLYGLSPYPLRSEKKSSGFNDVAASGSPSGPSMLFNSDAHDHLQTPLISKAPKLAPPSTARLPSQFMPMSSPAPFWKYADFTPAKFDSPVKMENAKMESADVKFRADAKNVARSSSPPLPEAEVGRGSPTKSLSNRGLDRGASSQPRQPSPPKHQRPGSTAPSAVTALSMPPLTQQSHGQVSDDSSDEEEAVIDLAKGFQPIGKFHSMGAVRGA